MISWIYLGKNGGKGIPGSWISISKVQWFEDMKDVCGAKE